MKPISTFLLIDATKCICLFKEFNLYILLKFEEMGCVRNQASRFLGRLYKCKGLMNILKSIALVLSMVAKCYTLLIKIGWLTKRGLLWGLHKT
jgi:hypothetical protein